MHEAGWQYTVEYMHAAACMDQTCRFAEVDCRLAGLLTATNIKNAQEAKLRGRPSVRTPAIASPTQIFDPETRYM